MNIGYVGVGSMGGALADRLLLTHTLIVFDVSVTATRVLAEKGARVAASLTEVATQCDVIFLCLPRNARHRTVSMTDTLTGLRSLY